MTLERDSIYNDLLDRVERLEARVEDIRDLARPTEVVIYETPDWQQIAGWVSTGTVLRSLNGEIVLDPTIPRIRVGAGGYIESADFDPGVAGFQINGGVAEFNDVVVRGTIYADVGEIGGWTIGAAELTGGDATLHSTGYLLLGTGNDIARLDAVEAEYRLWIGHATALGAPFSVTKAGALYASDAWIAGTIHANDGYLGTLEVTGLITVGASSPSLQIDGPNKRIQSSTFASGLSGMRVEANGDAEFNNVRIRGAMTSAVFVKDLVEVIAGTWIVVPSGGVLYEDMVVPGAGTWTAIIEDPPGGGFLFENGDICQCQSEYSGGIGEVWFTVSARVDNGDGTQSYTCTYQDGTRSITYPAGAPVLDYGVSGDGGLILTADAAGAPRLTVFTHAGSPWSALTEHGVFGNLNGVAGIGSDTYGLFVGDYAGGTICCMTPAGRPFLS